MKHLISAKSLATVALALGAMAAASSAQARSDVYFSIGVQVPGLYVQPGPVYVQPHYVQPQYVQPQYVQPHTYYTPAPVYYQRHDNGHRYGRQHLQRRGPYGDLDRDGIKNYHDRDLDGDGVRNRYDRLPGNPYRW